MVNYLPLILAESILLFIVLVCTANNCNLSDEDAGCCSN